MSGAGHVIRLQEDHIRALADRITELEKEIARLRGDNEQLTCHLANDCCNIHELDVAQEEAGQLRGLLREVFALARKVSDDPSLEVPYRPRSWRWELRRPSADLIDRIRAVVERKESEG
jgi:uncharacterized coiled-coil protein SlyX